MNPNDQPEPNATPVPEGNSTPVVEQPTPQPISTPQPLATPASPFAPADPSTPSASTAPLASAPSPKNKKLLPIIAIAVGALVLIGGGLVAFFLLTSVSKADYRAAADQFNKVTSANSALSSAGSSLNYSVGGDSDNAFTTDLKDVEDGIAKVKSENEALGKLKAVRVGEGAGLYKTFNDKLTARLAFESDYLTSMKSVRPALVTCKASGSVSTAERTDALKKCATALGDVKNIPVPEIATYVSSLKDGYTTYATLYEKMSKLTNPYGSQYDEYKSLRDQIYSAQDKVSDASDTYKDALKKRQDELSVKESADKLATLLTDKQK